MNETDDRGRLPLDLALATAQYGIAKSLVEHQVKIIFHKVTQLKCFDEKKQICSK